MTQIIRNYLDELAAGLATSAGLQPLLRTLRHNSPELASLSMSELQAAVRRIQALEPRPGRNFSYSPIATVVPDLTVQPAGGSTDEPWEVALVRAVESRFGLNAEAIALLDTPLPPTKRQQLEALFQQAQSLLTALSQWQENLLKVGQFLCDRQQAFLRSRNPLDLLPTSQQLVAQAVSLSDATVSRIVRDRYLLLNLSPQQILPLSCLCPAAAVGGRTPQQIQQVIQELIQAEPPHKPYSDAQLVHLLKLRFGLAIARRTVAKYRTQLGIANAAQRRKLTTTP
jgi:RNA polymerase sigma-54 factor